MQTDPGILRRGRAGSVRSWGDAGTGKLAACAPGYGDLRGN